MNKPTAEQKREVRLHNEAVSYRAGYHAGYEQALYDIEYKNLHVKS